MKIYLKPNETIPKLDILAQVLSMGFLVAAAIFGGWNLTFVFLIIFLVTYFENNKLIIENEVKNDRNR